MGSILWATYNPYCYTTLHIHYVVSEWVVFRVFFLLSIHFAYVYHVILSLTWNYYLVMYVEQNASNNMLVLIWRHLDTYTSVCIVTPTWKTDTRALLTLLILYLSIQSDGGWFVSVCLPKQNNRKFLFNERTMGSRYLCDKVSFCDRIEAGNYPPTNLSVFAVCFYYPSVNNYSQLLRSVVESSVDYSLTGFAKCWFVMMISHQFGFINKNEIHVILILVMNMQRNYMLAA